MDVSGVYKVDPLAATSRSRILTKAQDIVQAVAEKDDAQQGVELGDEHGHHMRPEREDSPIFFAIEKVKPSPSASEKCVRFVGVKDCMHKLADLNVDENVTRFTIRNAF